MSITNTPAAVVLFSKASGGKTQAGTFSGDEIARASAAALKHGASAVAFCEGDDADLLAAIPAGTFGEGEKPVLGPVKGEVFRRLAEMAEAQAKAEPAEKSPEKAA